MKSLFVVMMLAANLLLCAGCVSQEKYDGVVAENTQLKIDKAQQFQWFVIILIVNNAAWFYFYTNKPARKPNSTP